MNTAPNAQIFNPGGTIGGYNGMTAGRPVSRGQSPFRCKSRVYIKII